MRLFPQELRNAAKSYANDEVKRVNRAPADPFLYVMLHMLVRTADGRKIGWARLLTVEAVAHSEVDLFDVLEDVARREVERWADEGGTVPVWSSGRVDALARTGEGKTFPLWSGMIVP